MEDVVATNAIDLMSVEGQTPGVVGFKERISAFRTGFPDLTITIEAMIAEGDTVAERSTFRGTHRVEFMGISATGKQ